MSELIEYRVRPVTRYVITRFERADVGELERSSIRTLGEYDNAEVAYEVAYALCKADHERLAWPLDDARIQYPRHPSAGTEPPPGGVPMPGLPVSNNAVRPPSDPAPTYAPAA